MGQENARDVRRDLENRINQEVRNVAKALLVEFYDQLPEINEGGDPKKWERKCHNALSNFKAVVQSRYLEGTLQRILKQGSDRARRAASLALGMVGSMTSNHLLAGRLRDNDMIVRTLTGDALWRIWMRADTESNGKELHRLMRLRNRDEALAGYDALIRRAPEFAEAYNQRAVLLFKMKEYQRSIIDCEKALKLNSCHFGALAGMAQSFMNLRKPRMALKAFRESYRINPNLHGVEQAIRELESVLGEERKDDRI
jgi:tetratricopeptide (TPR) repeat protein